jgi:hypothetical protein
MLIARLDSHLQIMMQFAIKQGATFYLGPILAPIARIASTHGRDRTQISINVIILTIPRLYIGFSS